MTRMLAGFFLGMLGTCLVIFLVYSGFPNPAVASNNAPGWTQLRGGNSPYNYPSVAFTCHGPDGVYVSSFSNSGANAGGDVTVIINDPECAR